MGQVPHLDGLLVSDGSNVVKTASTGLLEGFARSVIWGILALSQEIDRCPRSKLSLQMIMN